VAATLMSLESPWMLLCLAFVPVVILAYVRAFRVRSERAGRLASEGLVPTTAGRWAGWRRHLPFAVFATALALLCFALARPTVSLALPQRQGTVILAFDVSNSMRAKDLEPTRIAAAKRAAIGFAERQPKSIRIGVVAFGDSAVTVLRPTNVKADVTAAIRRLGVGGGTALGQGIYTSLNAIAGKKLTIDASALERDAGSVKVGFYGSSAIVLLSDGENTSSRPDPVGLAEVASTAGVRIHAIGVGTKEGTVVQIDGFSEATALDEDLLKKIAAVTDGTYHQAGDAESLAQVYKSIELETKNVEKPRETTALFAIAGGLLLVLGSVLSLAWFGRVI
jgi:Ca-activated chloride channel homolog